MYAIITGASSGIGRDISFELAKRGYNLILVARSEEKLNKIKNEIILKHSNIECLTYSLDITSLDNINYLFEQVKNKKIEVLVNNAGLGKVGFFSDIPLDDELNIINVNVIALQSFTKIFLPIMEKGHILNVSSVAAFEPGPKMITYYSSKVYVYNFSLALNYELRKQKRKVYVSVLCPGPVNTNFNNVANVRFALKGISSEKCARIAVKGMLKKKKVICTSFFIKLTRFFTKIIPSSITMRVAYKSQSKKID